MTPPSPDPPPLPPPGYSQQQIQQIVDAVRLGGRYKVYPWCFSVVILSFLRSSKIIFVPAGKDGARHAVGHLALSLVVGPWGIPFGLIFTFWCFIRNLMGGKDVTREVLARFVGEAQAGAILQESRPAPARWGLWSLRMAPLIVIGVVAVAIGSLGRDVPRAEAEERGESSSLGRLMASSRSGVSGSDAACDELARTLAAEQSGLLHSSLMNDSGVPAGVFVRVERVEEGAVIAISCPDLNKFSETGKRDFARAGWNAAAKLMKDPKGRHEGKSLLTVLHDGSEKYALIGKLGGGEPRFLSRSQTAEEADRLVGGSGVAAGAAADPGKVPD